MVEDKIAVVVVSRLDDVGGKKEKHITSTSGFPTKFVYVINPDGVSLTSIYADMINKLDNRYIVFVHDDVEFLRNGWGKDIVELFKANKDYGILGVAGSAQFDETAAWWQYKKIYGQVLHRHDANSWLSVYSPLLGDEVKEVCVVDGLFFAVDKERVKVNFDTSFEGFNFYEIDFCLANYLSKSCKVGVTTKVRLAHSSVGELKENWYVNREKLVKKYGDAFPIDVEKGQK